MQKAKGYAFLLLKFRLRSEREIRERLQRKKFSAEIVQEALSFLKEKSFLDDALFAREWISSRLKRPLALRRIGQELEAKGISEKIIQSQLGEAAKGYCEGAVIQQLAEEKIEKLRGIEPRKAKQRVYSYLLRRGFSPEAIIDAMNNQSFDVPRPKGRGLLRIDTEQRR